MSDKIDPVALDHILDHVQREWRAGPRDTVWPWPRGWRRQRKLTHTLDVLHGLWCEVHAHELARLLRRGADEADA